MVRRTESEPTDHDEQIGEAIETYLALAEAGPPPEPEVFAARYPGLEDDLLAALEGLALVRGLVGEADGPGHGLESGRRIAGYRIVRELGRGGMGVVYEAVHVGLDRPVALKVLGGHAAPDSTGRRRFLNEARTAAGLHHTHIVPVFDVGQVGGLCYYAMQRIEGSGLDRVIRHMRRDRTTAAGSALSATSLRSRFGLRLSSGTRGAPAVSPPRGSESETGHWPRQPGGPEGLTGSHGPGGGLAASPRERDDEPPPFEPPRGSAYYRWVAEVGREAAEALGHAHHRGVIHRDVKPSNLLVDGRGLVWVADFGLARRLADPGLTQHDSLLGTPRYMSPEQARVGPIDGRSDLFSLGATLYELLTLRPPFDGRSAAELVEQIAGREPSAPRQTDPRIPRDLETIVLKLLSKRPADRYPSAAAVAEDLTRFLNHEPVQARRISPLGRLWRFTQRHPSITIVSTAAAITVLAVTTVAYVKILHGRDEAVKARDQAVKAVRTGLWREASVIRHSNMPDRRMKGLGRIKEAAAMKPEPELRAQLRDEAVEFLAMRDVEARPGLATGPGQARALVFGADGARLAALTDSEDPDLLSLSIWDVAHRVKLAEKPGGPRRDGRGPSGPGGPVRPTLVAAGQCVAMIAPEGQGVRLFDAVTGARIDDLKMPGHRIHSLFATPDGQRLVTVESVWAGRSASSPGKPPEGENKSSGGAGKAAAAASKPAAKMGPPPMQYVVNLWNPEQVDLPLKTLAQFDADPILRGGPALVAISPDGKTVAVARARKTTVSLWQAETGAAIDEINTQIELTALALGADQQLATAGSGEIRLWDVDSLTPLPSLTPNQSAVQFLRFSPQGSLLAVVGFGGRSVELWDTAAHSLVAVLQTPDRMADLAFSPDGRTLAAAVGGQASETLIWAVVESDVRMRLSGFDAMTRSMAFRPDGLLAMGAFNGRVRFWSEGRCVHWGGLDGTSPGETAKDREEPAAMRPISLAFDDRGRLITLQPEELQVWEDSPRFRIGTRVQLKGSSGGMTFPVLAAAHDGRTMVIARNIDREPRRDRGGRERVAPLLVWRSNAPEKLDELTPPPALNPAPRGRDSRGFGPIWRTLALSPAGDRLYFVENNDVHAWTLAGTKARALAWTGLPKDATTLALSSDGGMLAVGDRTGGVTLIDTAKGTTLTRLTPPSGEGGGLVSSLAFSPVGNSLAVGTQQGQIDLWSVLRTPTMLVRLPGHREIVTALTFDAQGRHLASAGDKTVDVWNLDRIREEFTRLGLAW
jgi:eukaryotic-like serine/threonine-protein kinase